MHPLTAELKSCENSLKILSLPICKLPFLALCAETLGYIFSLHYFGFALKKSSEFFK